MNVAALMTQNVACCSMSDTLETAARLMWDRDCGCLPVVDDQGCVVGVITDRDIAMAALSQAMPLNRISVGTAASTSPICAEAGDSIEKAESLMQMKQVRRLPVIDRGRLAGILSMNDLARRSQRASSQTAGLSADAIAKTLAAVCAPHSEARV